MVEPNESIVEEEAQGGLLEERTPVKRKQMDCESTEEFRRCFAEPDEELFPKKPRRLELDKDVQFSEFQLEDSEDVDPNMLQKSNTRIFGIDIKNICLRKEERK